MNEATFGILVTNDDGIESPGLKAAVESVAEMGEVTVVAPTHQQTGTGRGLVGNFQSSLQRFEYRAGGRSFKAFHCEGSPALLVNHSLRTVFRKRKPDLVISGINYGENLGLNITHSGTIGAALEASCFGIPSIAVSKQTDIESHHKFSRQDWEPAKYFLSLFAGILLRHTLPPDVHVLKIDVPETATPATEWEITRLAKSAYYKRHNVDADDASALWDGETVIDYDKNGIDRESDIYAVAIRKHVSVTPLSADLTARVDPGELRDVFTRPRKSRHA